jgi:aspartate/methionine/tyrosine aminotransferase
MESKPLSPDSAAAIWQRAAQLQAEAAQRLEERSRVLSASAGSPNYDPHDFSVDEVRAAARDIRRGDDASADVQCARC